MMELLAAVALMASAADEASSPQLLNQNALVSGKDYPVGAVLLEQQGTTGVLVTVDAAGKVSDCVVEQSSGFAALDAQTCRLYWLRAKFAPARDGLGRPIAATYSQRFTWRMTDAERSIEPWTVRVLALVTRKSDVKDCAVESSGEQKEPMRGFVKCSELAGAFKIQAELLKSLAGKQTVLVFDQQFVPKVVNGINTPRDLRRFRLLGREVVNVRVGADGAVTKCIQKEVTGPFQPATGTCELLPRRRFEIPKNEAGDPVPLWGTATMSVYATP